ncbi:response regulator receiver domain-containing protein [Pseudoduganella lurida]|uniref:Response regulator receiver domain-containing protein n=1 Tax=Pseudoduganella lurida TaxID=1036180 RepID=A0A562RC89_9BURK|nr:response regulator [Pseudoduganella lurida]TWI66194.1 response regulator receiver domain-containing protein [Pseudoduganella lurida]
MGKPCEIMVVDDNLDAASTLSELVQCLGYKVEVAHDGVEALDKLQAFHPSIVFLDIGMPRMDGFELARRIRSNAELASAYLVSVSGWNDPATAARAQAAGIDLHVRKPISLEQIQSTLAHCEQ